MLKVGRPDNVDLSSLSMIACPGLAVPDSYIQELKKIFPGTLILQSFGQTEVGGAITLFTGYSSKKIALALSNTRSIGLPREGMSYRVS